MVRARRERCHQGGMKRGLPTWSIEAKCRKKKVEGVVDQFKQAHVGLDIEQSMLGAEIKQRKRKCFCSCLQHSCFQSFVVEYRSIMDESRTITILTNESDLEGLMESQTKDTEHHSSG